MKVIYICPVKWIFTWTVRKNWFSSNNIFLQFFCCFERENTRMPKLRTEILQSKTQLKWQRWETEKFRRISLISFSLFSVPYGKIVVFFLDPGERERALAVLEMLLSQWKHTLLWRNSIQLWCVRQLSDAKASFNWLRGWENEKRANYKTQYRWRNRHKDVSNCRFPFVWKFQKSSFSEHFQATSVISLMFGREHKTLTQTVSLILWNRSAF